MGCCSSDDAATTKKRDAADSTAADLDPVKKVADPISAAAAVATADKVVSEPTNSGGDDKKSAVKAGTDASKSADDSKTKTAVPSSLPDGVSTQNSEASGEMVSGADSTVLTSSSAAAAAAAAAAAVGASPERATSSAETAASVSGAADAADAAAVDAQVIEQRRTRQETEIKEKKSSLQFARESLARGLKVLDVLSSVGPEEEVLLLPVIQDSIELSDLLEQLSKSSEGIDDSDKALLLILKVGALMQQLVGIDPSLALDAEGTGNNTSITTTTTTTSRPGSGRPGSASASADGDRSRKDDTSKKSSVRSSVEAVAKAAEERKTSFAELSNIDKQRRVSAISQLIAASRNCIDLAAEERLTQKVHVLAAQLEVKQVTDTRGLPHRPTSASLSNASSRNNSPSSSASPSPQRIGSPPVGRKRSLVSAAASSNGGGGGSRFSTPGGKSDNSSGSGAAAATKRSSPVWIDGKRPSGKPHAGAKSPNGAKPAPKVPFGARSPSGKSNNSSRSAGKGSVPGSPPGMGAAKGRNINSKSVRRGGARLTRTEKENLLCDMESLFNPSLEAPDDTAAGQKQGSRRSGASSVSSRLTAPRKKAPSSVASNSVSAASKTRRPAAAASSVASSSASRSKPPRALDSRALSSAALAAAGGPPPRRPASYSGQRGGGGGGAAGGGGSVVMPSAVGATKKRSAASVAAVDAARKAAARVQSSPRTGGSNRSPTTANAAARRRQQQRRGRGQQHSAASSASQIFPTLGDADNIALSAPIEELLVQLMHTGRLVRSRGFADMPLEARSHVLRMVRDLLMQCRAKSFTSASLASATLETRLGLNSAAPCDAGSSAAYLRSTFDDSSATVGRRQAAIVAFVNSMERTVAAAESELIKKFARHDSVTQYRGAAFAPSSPPAPSLVPGRHRPGSGTSSLSRPSSPPSRLSPRLQLQAVSRAAAMADAVGVMEAGDVNTGLSFEEQYRHSSPVRVLLSAFKLLLSADFVSAMPFERDQLQRLMKSQLQSAKRFALALPEERRTALQDLTAKIQRALAAQGMSIAGSTAGSSLSSTFFASSNQSIPSLASAAASRVSPLAVDQTISVPTPAGRRSAALLQHRRGKKSVVIATRRVAAPPAPPPRTRSNLRNGEALRRAVQTLNDSLVSSRKMLCSPGFAIMSAESQQNVFDLIEEQLVRTREEIDNNGAFDDTTAEKLEQLAVVLNAVREKMMRRHANLQLNQSTSWGAWANSSGASGSLGSSSNISQGVGSSIFDRFKPTTITTTIKRVVKRARAKALAAEDDASVDIDEEDEIEEVVEEQEQLLGDDGTVPSRQAIVGTWTADGKSQLTLFSPTHWLFETKKPSGSRIRSSGNIRKRAAAVPTAVSNIPFPAISVSPVADQVEDEADDDVFSLPGAVFSVLQCIPAVGADQRRATVLSVNDDDQSAASAIAADAQ